MPHPTFIRELGGGLILRRATPEDRDALVRFNAITHSDSDEPDPHVAGHTYDLISGRLPGFQAGDFTIVEDASTGQIVSSLSLIPQVWAYEGIPFQVGRPEIVGTAPAYRRRGLVREQFAEVHQWSKARGDVVQVITGNPWYYRQFGYELALTLGGGRMGYGPNIPRLKAGAAETYAIRPACADDLPFIARLYDRAMARQPIHCQRSEALWRYELDGRSETNLNRKTLHIIERAGGPGNAAARAGFFALTPWLWGANMWLSAYEIDSRQMQQHLPKHLPKRPGWRLRRRCCAACGRWAKGTPGAKGKRWKCSAWAWGRSIPRMRSSRTACRWRANPARGISGWQTCRLLCAGLPRRSKDACPAPRWRAIPGG